MLVGYYGLESNQTKWAGMRGMRLLETLLKTTPLAGNRLAESRGSLGKKYM